jgi:hypothetical protein
MLLFLAAGSWFLFGFLAGLVTATPWLRSFGLVGTVVFFGFALLWHHVRSRPVLVREDERRDDWAQVDWDGFPDYRDEERAA